MKYKNKLLINLILLSSGFIYCMNQNNIINNKQKKFEQFKYLPIDIQKEILQNLNYKDIKNFRLVNKALKNISEDIFKKKQKIANESGLELIYIVSYSYYKGGQDNIKQLINSNNVNLNSKAWEGCTALMVASDLGLTSIAIELINAGTNLDLQDRYGNTALFSAVMFNRKEIIKFLIKNNAKFDLKNQKGKTALNFITSREIKYFILKAINEKIKMNLFDQLHEATNEKILSYLNCKDIKNFRLVSKRAKNMAEEIFDVMLKYKILQQ